MSVVGVTRHEVKSRKSGRGWVAQITVNRKRCYLGFFASEEDAARAFDVAALEAFGEFATLNFPELREEGG